MKRKVFNSVFGVLLLMLAAASQALAVEYCSGIYSPNNPFACYKGGNCVWWTWHWLRWGKGDRNLVGSSNPFRRDARYWAIDAANAGYTVDGNLESGAIAVNETQRVLINGVYVTTGHVAEVTGWDDVYIYTDEMTWGVAGLEHKKYLRSKGYFTKFIHPHPQPSLSRILPEQIYHAGYDQNVILYGKNLDRVARVELTFPNGFKGVLSGTQLPWKSDSQIGLIATFGTSGRYVVNVVTDKNIESIPQMPFWVY